MKNLFCKLMIIGLLATGLHAPEAKSDSVLGDPNVSDDGLSVTSAIWLFTTFLAKEMVEVAPDAANYVATGEASLALQSVVEKFQETSLEQGQELSFDEVVDVINTIER